MKDRLEFFGLRRACIGNDATCPCQDGDACPYEGADAWPVPTPEPAPCPLCRCAKSGYSGLYNTACAGCRARDIARGPLFFAAKRATKGEDGYEAARDAYRDALAAAEVDHAAVMEWAR